MIKQALTWKNSQTRSLLRFIITLEFPRFCREKFAHSDQREGSGWTPILIICLQLGHKKIIGSFQNQRLQGLQSLQIKENQWIFRSRLKDSSKSKIERRRQVKICLITSTSARILIKNNQSLRTPTNLHTIRPCLNCKILKREADHSTTKRIRIQVPQFQFRTDYRQREVTIKREKE